MDHSHFKNASVKIYSSILCSLIQWHNESSATWVLKATPLPPTHDARRRCPHLKVWSAILIRYPFCKIQWIAPHSPIAVHFVCVLKEPLVFIHTQSWLCKREANVVVLTEPHNMLLQEALKATPLKDTHLHWDENDMIKRATQVYETSGSVHQ